MCMKFTNMIYIQVRNLSDFISIYETNKTKNKYSLSIEIRYWTYEDADMPMESNNLYSKNV